jgi:hypothetical protein
MTTSTSTSTTTSIIGTTRNLYAVLENGDLYPALYDTYEAARDAVLTNHADQLEDERSDDGFCTVSKVDVDENTGDTGTTHLYIEKGISIIIQRYKVGMPPQ